MEFNQVSLGAAAYDPARHDWTNDSWATAMRATCDTGRRNGLQVDHIYTPGWSAGTTTVAPDGPGSASWTAPPVGTWAVVGSWMMGTGHTVGLAGTTKTTYLVDHFSLDGIAAINELFRDHHLKPLAAWAHQPGLTLRGQPYSSWGPAPVAMQELAGLLDVAEGEDRSFTSGSGLNHRENRSSGVWPGCGDTTPGAARDLYFTDQSLARAGYTYGFLGRTQVSDPAATVRDGKLLIDRLRRNKNVREVSSESAVAPALAAAGVRPAASLRAATRLPGGVRIDISATSGNGVLVALTKGNEDTVRAASPWISTAVMSYETGETPETTTRKALAPIYSVELNGRKLPPADLMDPSAIAVSLRQGANSLRVHVATLLGNAAYGSRQPYGLMGPVRIHQPIRKEVACVNV